MQKGQIFSLDFLISLVAVTAAIGLLIQAVELNTYYGKEAREFNELKAVAEAAASIVVASNETTCSEADQSLMNCIDTTNADEWLSSVPVSHKFEIRLATNGTTRDSGTAFANQDFYEARRRVVVGSRSGPQDELVVRVWKP